MDYEIIKTEKGKDAILKDGHIFERNSEDTNGKKYWRCSNYYTTKCNARIHTLNGSILKKLKDHNHAANAAEVESKKNMQILRGQSKISNIGSTQEILTNVMSTVSPAASFYMPLKRSMQRSIRKLRQKESDSYEPIPLVLKDLIIPEKYKFTKKGDLFLIKDTGADDPCIKNRIILYGTNENIKTLSRCDEYFMDGTFKSCPKIFSQLYIIHGLYEGVPMPLVYALLCSKTSEIYKKMFELLNEIYPLNPQKIHIDFEMAMIKTLTNIFKGAQVICCFFHLQKSIYHHLGVIGSKIKYDTDVNFAFEVRTLISIAFVPIEHQERYYEILMENNLLNDDDDLINYFESNYFGLLRPNGLRRKPRFPRELWNFHEEARNSGHKTNNIAEGFNNALNHLINISGPNIWQLLQVLQKKQGEMEFGRDQVRNQREMGVPQKKKYKDLSEHISRVANNFNNYDPFDYMKAIAAITRIDYT